MADLIANVYGLFSDLIWLTENFLIKTHIDTGILDNAGLLLKFTPKKDFRHKLKLTFEFLWSSNKYNQKNLMKHSNKRI